MAKEPKPGDKVKDPQGNTYVVQDNGALKSEPKSPSGFVATMVESVGHTVSQMTPGKTK